MVQKNERILEDYIRANLAHELRTPYAAINVSLNSIKKLFPELIDGYEKACEAGLIERNYKKDFLNLVDKSIKNSISEVKFCEFYLNKLLLLMQAFPITQKTFYEKINIRVCVEHCINSLSFRGAHYINFVSNNTFDVEFNKIEFESYLQLFMEEVFACQNEQQADSIKIDIDTMDTKLLFKIMKSKSNSHVCKSIKKFEQGDFSQRFGMGFYLLKRLTNIKQGNLELSESPNDICFVVKF